jgi:ribosomal protein S18 acetylase RimI-like enzyme
MNTTIGIVPFSFGHAIVPNSTATITSVGWRSGLRSLSYRSLLDMIRFVEARLHSLLNIRQAGQHDARVIAKLHAASWRSAYRGILSDAFLDGRADEDRLRVWTERFSQPSAKPMFVLVAENDNDLIGFVCVYPAADNVFGSFVDNLHVVPTLTGRGIGRRLFSDAAKRLIADGYSCGVFLWVLEKNELAWRFYERARGVHTDSAVHLMPDGQKILVRRYHWSSPSSLSI